VTATAPPEPPRSPVSLDPLITVWPEGHRIIRCHDSAFGGTQYNPSPDGSSRFRPFSAAGAVVPVMYGADLFEGALAETLFHGVLGGDAESRVFLSRYRTWTRSTIAPKRELRLIELSTFGLRRLGLERRHLIDTGPDAYAYTARWATALYKHPARPDGLLWVSRLYDVAKSMILFGTRVPFSDLAVVDVPLALAVDPGLSAVMQAATYAAINVVHES
jgi:hypothetical protein